MKALKKNILLSYIIYEIKFQTTPELANLWGIGCNLWKRDFPGIYKSLKQSWSPAVQPFITILEGKLSFIQNNKLLFVFSYI